MKCHLHGQYLLIRHLDNDRTTAKPSARPKPTQWAFAEAAANGDFEAGCLTQIRPTVTLTSDEVARNRDRLASQLAQGRSSDSAKR